MSGRVTDPATGVGLAGSYVAIERGGSYVPNPDTSTGSPAYQFGAITDANGSFTLTVPGGKLGVHTFTSGRFYGTHEFEATGDLSVEIKSEPLKPTDARPTLSDPKLDASTVSPGDAVTLTVTVKAVDAMKDPLSDEVILIEPTTHWSAAVDPPSPGVQGRGFPNGVWKKKFTAPSVPGHYTYGLAATTEACVTGDVVRLVLDVK